MNMVRNLPSHPTIDFLRMTPAEIDAALRQGGQAFDVPAGSSVVPCGGAVRPSVSLQKKGADGLSLNPAMPFAAPLGDDNYVLPWLGRAGEIATPAGPDGKPIKPSDLYIPAERGLLAGEPLSPTAPTLPDSSAAQFAIMPATRDGETPWLLGPKEELNFGLAPAGRVAPGKNPVYRNQVEGASADTDLLIGNYGHQQPPLDQLLPPRGAWSLQGDPSMQRMNDQDVQGTKGVVSMTWSNGQDLDVHVIGVGGGFTQGWGHPLQNSVHPLAQERISPVSESDASPAVPGSDGAQQSAEPGRRRQDELPREEGERR
jgi:hypothetical protein